ncbi:MAG: hypothetical protein ABIE22_04560 [archaeon]
MQGLDKKEERVFRKLNSPKKIQRFLDKLEMNWELNGDTCMSPRQVMRKKRAHCIEGAIFAAAALRFHGLKPLIVDLEAADCDDDHVIAVFKQYGKWGAITKTNHGVLRYREPVYRDIRELVMSFFHEYFSHKGKRTLRAYSNPIDLSRFDKKNWVTSEEDVWFIPEYLVDVKHTPIVTKKQIANFNKPHPIEVAIGKIIEWPDPLKRRKQEKIYKNLFV